MTNWDGAEYRQVSTLQQWLADRVLAGVNFTDAQSVLDIGCGDGRITARIAKQLPDAMVVGTDISAGMLAVASAGGRLHFCRSDANHLPFFNAFDVIVSFNALHWIADQSSALRQIANGLHYPGRAYLVLVCAGSRPSLERVAMDVTIAPTWAAYFADFSPPFQHPNPSTYRDAARAAGLEVVDMRVEDLGWDFGTAEQFTRWATVGFDAWTSRLPAERRQMFMTDVMTAYQMVTGSPLIFRFTQMATELVSRA